jgi:hypothetical protein
MSWFDRFRPYPQLERVIVNLKSGTVFRGLLWRRRGPFYVMREVEMLSDRDSKMDPRVTNGEVLVKLADIDFIQVP